MDIKTSPTLNYELTLWKKGIKYVAGIDEVGRGCLAGPIVVGAVIFEPSTIQIEGVRDSKMLSATQRETLAERIKEKALRYAIGVGSVQLINDQGIVPALKFAVQAAIQSLSHCNHLLIDGSPLKETTPYWLLPTNYIVKGDSLVYSIAAASIIAKVYRDNLMSDLAQEFPLYGWERNVGYGTKEHRESLLKNGKSEHHRELFLRKILS